MADLKGENVDLENIVLYITGKGGKHRTVKLPVELAEQLNPSMQYLFNPSRSLKQAFYQTVREAAREAREKVLQDAGHNRVEVTYSYVPEKKSA